MKKNDEKKVRLKKKEEKIEKQEKNENYKLRSEV